MILHGQEGRDSLQIPVLEVENARSIPESKPTEKQWKEVFFPKEEKENRKERNRSGIIQKLRGKRKRKNRSKMSSSLQTAMKDVK